LSQSWSKRVSPADGEIDYSYLEDDHSAGLLRIVARYPDVVGTAFKNLEPPTVLTYLFRLAHQLSWGYDVLQVVGAPEGYGAALARAALYENARQVLGNGMRLLGIRPVKGKISQRNSFPANY
jgi:arginyl-tRNA synthetase